MYSAIVLDKTSREELKNLEKNIKVAGFRLPVLIEYRGWKRYNHHMTICMGELPNYLKQYLGTQQKLVATHIGISPMAVAVKVYGFESKNKIPHVTMAVNVANGGEPVMSNKITEWTPLESKITLRGIVEEVKQ